MKVILTCLLMVMLFSCSKADKPNATEVLVEERVPVVEPATASDGMAEVKEELKQTTYDTTGTYTANDFAGKLFLLGSSDPTVICRVMVECDCCLSDLLFVTANMFVLNNKCEGSEYVLKGKYSVSGREMLFTFDPLQVAYEYNWARESDSTAVPFFLKSERKESYGAKFSVANCQESPIMIMTTVGTKVLAESEREIARVDSETTFAARIREMKENGIWSKLQMPL